MDCVTETERRKQKMKKNILFLVGGVIAGIALCLTAAKYLPIDSFYEESFF